MDLSVWQRVHLFVDVSAYSRLSAGSYMLQDHACSKGMSTLQLRLIQVQPCLSSLSKFVRMQTQVTCIHTMDRIPFGLGIVDIYCYCNPAWTHFSIPVYPDSLLSHVLRMLAIQVQLGLKLGSSSSVDKPWNDVKWPSSILILISFRYPWAFRRVE